MRITVNDILGWLASGMSVAEILEEYDELEANDVYAALSYAADRENKTDQPEHHKKVSFASEYDKFIERYGFNIVKG